MCVCEQEQESVRARMLRAQSGARRRRARAVNPCAVHVVSRPGLTAAVKTIHAGVPVLTTDEKLASD